MYTERQAIGLLFKILWAAFFLKLSPNVYSKHKKITKALHNINTMNIKEKLCWQLPSLPSLFFFQADAKLSTCL